jgi:hypothetical protein
MLSHFLNTLGFTALNSEHRIFARGNIYIAVHVDDLLIAGLLAKEIKGLKEKLSAEFEMIDLRTYHFYLGIVVKRDRQRRVLSLS